jgi:hypothetical protein
MSMAHSALYGKSSVGDKAGRSRHSIRVNHQVAFLDFIETIGKCAPGDLSHVRAVNDDEVSGLAQVGEVGVFGALGEYEDFWLLVVAVKEQYNFDVIERSTGLPVSRRAVKTT